MNNFLNKNYGKIERANLLNINHPLRSKIEFQTYALFCSGLRMIIFLIDAKKKERENDICHNLQK